ncbi:MAG: class B sortase [Bacilli bacterium]|nr:class B sortase [Bacilli bacterium]
MHKILIEVKRNTLSFSLYDSKKKVENLNNTNVINTEKMVFSDNYINDNLDLVVSFFNLVVLKKNINKVIVSINAIFPLVFRIINNISNIKNVILLEDKAISCIIFEHLLESNYIENFECYSISSFMYDKLDIEKEMVVKSRCEVLFVSKFMEENEFNTYSDVYYKKSINVSNKLDKYDKDDIESFFRFNNKIRVINLYLVSKDLVNYIIDMIEKYNKKNVKILLHQEDDEREIITLADDTINSNKKLFKNNNIKLKVSYTKEYRDKNTMKQVNLNFFRFILILFIILAILIGVIFSIKYKEDTDEINTEMDELNEAIDLNQIDEFIAEEEDIIIEDEEEKQPSKNTSGNSGYVSPYYRKFSQVFDDLIKINDETVGWLKVNNTKINYPVTQHSDNDYYLNYSYYKKKNSHGWIFMDYRNKIDILDKNTIIYGHRNSKGLMFGTLKNVLEKSWYTNKNNQVITFNTLNQDMKWQIFSIYTLKNTNDYLITNFSSDTTYTNFISKIKGRSIYDFGVEVDVDDNILTLSTCYNGPEHRLVVHAKLIK